MILRPTIEIWTVTVINPELGTVTIIISCTEFLSIMIKVIGSAVYVYPQQSQSILLQLVCIQ